VRCVTDPEPEPAADETAEPEPGDGETPEQKRARVMARLAEIIRSDPPQLSGGPVSPGGFPTMPSSADEFDQEKAAELFAALGQFFEKRTRPGDAAEAAETEPEGD
jgi:hypothetical protein